MSVDWVLRCTACGFQTAIEPLISGCPKCAQAGAIEVLEACCQPAQIPTRPPPGGAALGLTRYGALLPGDEPLVSLGEGSTPLLPSRQIGPSMGLSRLWFKLESCNPTSSFKDRYCMVSMNLARQFGYERVVLSSTGNLGVSAAAYAAALGLECLLIALPATPATLLDQVRAYGATVVTTDSGHRQAVFEQAASRPGWFPIGLMLPRPIQNPFGVEGYRTLAWEMLDVLGGPPGAVLFPCARGNGLYGTWKGFVEARSWHWSDSVPRMFACQPAGANSIEVTLNSGAVRAVELSPIHSLAASAAETVSDDRAIAAVRASQGGAGSCDEAALRAATKALAREGIYVEASSALPVACLAHFVAAGAIAPDEVVVCVLTAAGDRWPHPGSAGRGPVPHLSGTDDLERFFETLGRETAGPA